SDDFAGTYNPTVIVDRNEMRRTVRGVGFDEVSNLTEAWTSQHREEPPFRSDARHCCPERLSVLPPGSNDPHGCARLTTPHPVGRTHPPRFIMERPALQARMFVDRSPCG